jgi:hypothetical protein
VNGALSQLPPSVLSVWPDCGVPLIAGPAVETGAGGVSRSIVKFVGVNDVDVAERVHHHPEGLSEIRAGGQAAVGRVPAGPVAGEDGELAVRRDLLDHVVALIGDVDVAGGIGGDARRVVQGRAGRRSGYGGPALAGAGEDREGAGGGDFSTATLLGSTMYRLPAESRPSATPKLRWELNAGPAVAPPAEFSIPA